MTIEMIPIEQFDYPINSTAKYLVKTKLMFGVNYIQASVSKNENGKISVGVNNQIITHISKIPL